MKASVAAHKMAKAEEKKERAVKMREENIQKKEEQGAKKTEKSKRSKKEDEAKSPAKDEAKASTVPQSSSADSSSTSASDGAEKPTETEETTYPGTSEEEQKAHIEVSVVSQSGNISCFYRRRNNSLKQCRLF